MARGGGRIGAGRKPKAPGARRLDGGLDRRTSKRRPLPVPAPTADVDPPDTLTTAELAVWLTNAPAAVAAGTLTTATLDDFAAMCALEVEMSAVLIERRDAGWTARGLALAREYRALVVRVESKRRSFCLSPIGKALPPPRPAPGDDDGDGFADFDRPRLIKGAS